MRVVFVCVVFSPLSSVKQKAATVNAVVCQFPRLSHNALAETRTALKKVKRGSAPLPCLHLLSSLSSLILITSLSCLSSKYVILSVSFTCIASSTR